MDCPKCDATELTTVTMPIEDRSRPGHQELSLEVDQCPSCDGLWFDAGEMDKYYGAGARALKVPKTAKATTAELDAKTGKCPRCAVAMGRGPSPYNKSVTLDVCGKCGGSWVDGDELDRAGGGGLAFADKMKAFFGDVTPGR